MSGSKKKPGVSKVAFIGEPPASFKLLWQPLIDWVKKVAVAEGIYVSLLLQVGEVSARRGRQGHADHHAVHVLRRQRHGAP